jgi:hypothetical protein
MVLNLSCSRICAVLWRWLADARRWWLQRHQQKHHFVVVVVVVVVMMTPMFRRTVSYKGQTVSPNEGDLTVDSLQAPQNTQTDRRSTLPKTRATANEKAKKKEPSKCRTMRNTNTSMMMMRWRRKILNTLMTKSKRMIRRLP